MSAETATRPRFRQRLIAGYHYQNDANGKEREYRPRRHTDVLRGGRILPADPPEWEGDVVESDMDYAEKWPEKFVPLQERSVPRDTDIRPGESLQDFAGRMAALASGQQHGGGEKGKVKADAPTADAPVNASTDAPAFILPVKTKEDLIVRLNAMTYKALMELAADEEIPMEGVKTKEQALAVLLKPYQ